MATARTFSNKILAKLEKTFSPADFRAQFVNGYWRSAKVSKRQEADLRKACLVKGIDPSSIGIPPCAAHKPLRVQPPKGHSVDLNKPSRMAKVQKAVDNLDQTIAKWKKDRSAEQAKAKPSLPY
ncbi:hypothetical protein IWQ61_000247 [Dispira simplex]|nr:hypothetical protein IWQ61_000247 [Dispira simplex]